MHLRDRPTATSISKREAHTRDSANDHQAHNRTYSSFIGALKWSVPLVAILTLLVVILIAE